MVYLDNAATTKISVEALNAMMPYLTDEYGNAGSIYKIGETANIAVENARKQVAEIFQCDKEKVIFTSCGSESNNAVFAGLRGHLSEAGKKHIVISALEHDSVLNAAIALKQDGFQLTIVRPNTDGYISARAISDVIRDDTGLVSVMYANNEVGTVNDIENIGSLCKEKGVLFHVDCVQAAGQYELDVERHNIDFASISGHKIHAPKGIGALYIKERNIDPLIYGGGAQEFSLRGGTENVASIVALGEASKHALSCMRRHMIWISNIKQRFYMALCEELKALDVGTDVLHINGMPVIEAGKVLNIRIDGIDAETLVLLMSAKGIYISSGSACNSHESKPSHVLLSMGLTPDEARSSIRVSFSKYNSVDEVVEAAHTMACCIKLILGL